MLFHCWSLRTLKCLTQVHTVIFSLCYLSESGWKPYSGLHNNSSNLSVPPCVEEWCFKWRKPFTLIKCRLLKSRVQTELVWCQGHSENRHTLYRLTAGNHIGMHRHLDGACSYSLMHTRTHAHTRTQPNVDMPNRDEHKSKQSMQTQK